MRKKKKPSISTFLISALGVLICCKVFILVIENFVFQTLGEKSLKVDDTYINIGIFIVVVILLVRVGYLYLNYRKKKSSASHEIAVTSEQASIETFHCATCGKVVSEKVRSYCLERQKIFNGKVYCYDHQRSSH